MARVLPTLTVCSLSNRPIARTTQVLNQYQNIADEIICAVDSSVPINEIGALEGIADKVVRCEFSPTHGIERNLAWLHSMCTSEWILRIDSDEVASHALLEIIPELISATDVNQYLIRRLWLYPDSRHAISRYPWSNDWQLRLVRNDPANLRFSGELHTSAELASPYRFVYQPMYHLDCLVNSVEQRAEKARRYEMTRPGHRTERGFPVNAFYQPENFSLTSPVEVPPSDASVVEEILRTSENHSIKIGSPRRWTPSAQPLPIVLFETIDRYWALRTLSPNAYQSSWETLDAIDDFRPNERRYVMVRVANDGDEIWPSGNQMPNIRLASRWLSADGSQIVLDGERTPFTADVAPGTSAVQMMVVTAPATPGDYILELRLVHELVRWFDGAAQHRVTISRELAQPYDADFYDAHLEGMMRSARAILPLVVELCHPASVVDIGCGRGAWLSVWRDLGVNILHGVDGSWASDLGLLIAENEFTAADLNIEIPIEGDFDLAMCLETAEHIAPDMANSLIRALTHLAPLVLFSAAVPYQGGAGHINEQWPSYWIAKFQDEGFICLDVLRDELWNNSDVDWWYRQNLFLFVERSHLMEGDELLKRKSSFNKRAVIHPALWNIQFGLTP